MPSTVLGGKQVSKSYLTTQYVRNTGKCYAQVKPRKGTGSAGWQGRKAWPH